VRVVLVRLSALGDVIHTWPLADALAAAGPDHHLTWIVEDALRPLVEGHPAVDAVLTVNTKALRRRPLSTHTRTHLSLLRSRLHELQPDVAIDPQGVVKSALISHVTGAPSRVGLARPWRRELLPGLAYTSTIPGSRTHRHVVATNMELVRAVGGIAPDHLPHPNGRWLLQQLSDTAPPVPTNSPYLALLPGAGQPDKILPAEDLGEVARWSADQGIPALVLWGPGEEERAEAVVEAAGGGATKAPPTDLKGLASVLGGARAVIGGDTGPVHLAASFAVPTLGVYTITDWRRNGPLGPQVAVVSGARLGDGGPTGSPRAEKPGPVSPREIIVALRGLLESSEP
jgi:heptosyltransferase-1